MTNWPLVLTHPHVRRILERRATALVLSRRLPVGTQGVHDALVIRRNHHHLRGGRPDLQADPLAFTIEVEDGELAVLVDIGLITIRAAGFRTTEEFFEDWRARRKRIDVRQTVHVHRFRIVEDSRYLHARVHRGYTSDSSLAARGEPQALSRSDLTTLARHAARDEEEFQRRARRSIGARMKQAAQQGDLIGIQRAQGELTLLLTAGSRDGLKT